MTMPTTASPALLQAILLSTVLTHVAGHMTTVCTSTACAAYDPNAWESILALLAPHHTTRRAPSPANIPTTALFVSACCFVCAGHRSALSPNWSSGLVRRASDFTLGTDDCPHPTPPRPAPRLASTSSSPPAHRHIP